MPPVFNVSFLCDQSSKHSSQHSPLNFISLLFVFQSELEKLGENMNVLAYMAYDPDPIWQTQ